MTTLYTHAFAGLAIAAIAAPRRMPWPYWVVAALLPVLPDLDTFAATSYSSIWGHRGFTHSLTWAAATGAITAALLGWYFRLGYWRIALVFFLAAASHPLLDMITKGGSGVALWWPIGTVRIGSENLGVIPVSDIALQWPDPRQSRALQAELLWVWLPLTGAVLVAIAVRWWHSTAATPPGGAAGSVEP